MALTASYIPLAARRDPGQFTPELSRRARGETTLRVIDRIQREGTCWCGGTTWQGRTAMRISVASWKTTNDDVERSLHAMVECWRAERAGTSETVKGRL